MRKIEHILADLSKARNAIYLYRIKNGKDAQLPKNLVDDLERAQKEYDDYMKMVKKGQGDK